MKLTKNDIAYLRKIGYNDNDIKEIDLGVITNILLMMVERFH